MLSESLSHLTRQDALAIATYLQSLPPVSNKVPGPFGPSDTPTGFVMSVQPGPVYAGCPSRNSQAMINRLATVAAVLLSITTPSFAGFVGG